VCEVCTITYSSFVYHCYKTMTDTLQADLTKIAIVSPAIM